MINFIKKKKPRVFLLKMGSKNDEWVFNNPFKNKNSVLKMV